MFKKNKKQTETIKEPKEKKVRTVKVGTHKKTVIALWVVLIASVSFGVYKNFTAIDQHTTHEKEIIELRLQDNNGIENFVKNFAKFFTKFSIPLVSCKRSSMISFSWVVCWSIAVKFLYTPKLTLAISTTHNAITAFLCVPTLTVRTFFSFGSLIVSVCFLFFLNIFSSPFYCFTRPAPIKCCCQ